MADDLISESKKNDNVSGVFSGEEFRKGSIGSDLFVDDISSKKND